MAVCIERTYYPEDNTVIYFNTCRQETIATLGTNDNPVYPTVTILGLTFMGLFFIIYCMHYYSRNYLEPVEKPTKEPLYKKWSSIVTVASNPKSAEKIPFQALLNLSKDEDKELSRRLNALQYNDYLQTPFWYSVREQVKKRDGYACKRCGKKEELQVHHLNYDWKSKEHRHLECLTTLCEYHHLMTESRIKL